LSLVDSHRNQEVRRAKDRRHRNIFAEVLLEHVLFPLDLIEHCLSILGDVGRSILLNF